MKIRIYKQEQVIGFQSLKYQKLNFNFFLDESNQAKFLELMSKVSFIAGCFPKEIKKILGKPHFKTDEGYGKKVDNWFINFEDINYQISSAEQRGTSIQFCVWTVKAERFDFYADQRKENFITHFVEELSKLKMPRIKLLKESLNLKKTLLVL